VVDRNDFRVTWTILDLAALRQQFPYPLASFFVQALPTDAGAGTLPRPLPPPELDDGPHLGYAIQWFAFATIAVVGWASLVLRRSAQRSRPRTRPARRRGRPRAHGHTRAAPCGPPPDRWPGLPDRDAREVQVVLQPQLDALPALHDDGREHVGPAADRVHNELHVRGGRDHGGRQDEPLAAHARDHPQPGARPVAHRVDDNVRPVVVLDLDHDLTRGCGQTILLEVQPCARTRGHHASRQNDQQPLDPLPRPHRLHCCSFADPCHEKRRAPRAYARAPFAG